MKPLLITFILCVTSILPAQAKPSCEYTNNEIVNAIWYAEGGAKTNFPYGIKSLPTFGSKEYARHICLTSVVNGRARWIKAGCQGDLIDHISRHYCPIGAPDDPNGLNVNWSRNVRKLLEKAK